MKKTLSVILLAVLALALAACGSGGSGESSDPNCGLYEGSTAEMMGFTMDISEIFEGGFSIELLDGGKAKFNYEGKSHNMKWTLDGTTFHAEGGGAKLDGTLSNGVMELVNVLDMGLNMTLVNNSYSGATGGSTASGGGDGSWWAGKWYGWRIIYDGGGEYADMVDNGYDVVANIQANGDTGTVTIWDYDESEADALVEAQVSFGADGSMTSEGGEAFYEPLGHADWIVDPSSSEVSAVDHMICIKGTLVEPDDSDSWFTYYFFLLPWGTTWDQVEAEQSKEDNDFPYKDMMPFHYEDWYLSQI